MIRLAAILLCLCAPLPALALSCLAPEVTRSYAQYAAAEETYVVVHGRLTLDTRDLPKGMRAEGRPPPLTLIEGTLRGYALTADGFDFPFDRRVTLEVRCISQWCGSARNGEDVLAFVRKDADGYALNIHPCGGAVFGTPKPEMLKQAEGCMARGDCTLD